MPETKFTTNGILVFPELGKDGKVTGPFPSLTVSAKRTVKDVEFTLTVPTAKAAKDNTLNGTTLGLKQNWSELRVFTTAICCDILAACLWLCICRLCTFGFQLAQPWVVSPDGKSCCMHFCLHAPS